VQNGRYALPVYRFFLRFLRRHLESSLSYSADLAAITASRQLHAQTPSENQHGRDARFRFRGLLMYCSDYHCSHWIAISGDPWPDDARLSDLRPARRGCAGRLAIG